MPSGSPIGSDPPFHPFLPIKETVPVQPSYGKTSARHPDDFTDGLLFIVDETQGGDRKDPVEGPVAKRKASEVSPDPTKGGGRTIRSRNLHREQILREDGGAVGIHQETKFQGAALSISASNCSIETFSRTRSNRRGRASSSEAIPFAFQRPPGIREGRIHGVPAYWDKGVSLIFVGKSFLKRTIRRFPDRRRAT